MLYVGMPGQQLDGCGLLFWVDDAEVVISGSGVLSLPIISLGLRTARLM